MQEGAAIGMADGFAQATGKPALVNLHAAAGMGNAMGNLINTRPGHVLVIVTSGQQARKDTELKAYLTNVDAPKLAEPLVTPTSGGVLPASIPAVASHFDGHGLIVAFGAPIFMYHEFADGDYLPAGAELWAVTSDPDEAARAPVGHILIGDPAEAVKRRADSIPGGGRPPLPAREPLPEAPAQHPGGLRRRAQQRLPGAEGVLPLHARAGSPRRDI